MICLKIENGVVVNSAIFESAAEGWIESTGGAGIGWGYSGGVFTPPATEQTQTVDATTVTKLQAVRYWQSGGLWPSVKAMLTADADLHDRWIAASELVITDPDVIALGAALEAQTGTALQQMFNEAGAL